MGPKKIADYLIHRHLRGGSYGELWRGRAIRTGEAVNVRVVHRWARDDCERLRREVQILRRLSSDHVVQLRDLKKTTTRFYMIFEAGTGGDLGQLLRLRGRLPEAAAWQFLAQIAAGLNALHSEVGAHHGDLRPGNILLTLGTGDACLHGSLGSSSGASCSGGSLPSSAVSLPSAPFSPAVLGLPTLKLANLGAASASAVGQRPAVSPYTAPEVLCGEPMGKQADVWAAGVVFHELLTGTTPFTAFATDKALLLEAMRASDVPWLAATMPFVGDAGRGLLLLLLDPLPERRPPIGEILNYSIKQCSTAALLQAADAIRPLSIPEEAIDTMAAWRLEAQATCRFSFSAGRGQSTSGLSPIREADAEADAEVDHLFQHRDEAPSSPSASRTPAAAVAAPAAPVAARLRAAGAGTSEAASASLPPQPATTQLPAAAVAALLQSMAARLGPSPELGYRWWPTLGRAAHGAGLRSAADRCRDGAGLDGLDGSASNVMQVKSFCVGELRKSHLFRIRFAQLFPRFLNLL